MFTSFDMLECIDKFCYFGEMIGVREGAEEALPAEYIMSAKVQGTGTSADVKGLVARHITGTL